MQIFFFLKDSVQGVLVCKSQESGWYPKSFFKGEEGPCVFESPKEVGVLHDSYEVIRSQIGETTADIRIRS